MHKQLIIFSSLIFFSCQHPESDSHNRNQVRTYDEDNNISLVDVSETPITKEIYYKVVKIKDGDTLVVLLNEEEYTIRLKHIDCPEKKQAFGTKAKSFLSELCFNRNVIISSLDEKDQYGRYLAEVFLDDGTNVNKELVKNGLAWHYKKFSDDNEYNSLENFARESMLNIWSEKTPIPPWEWRKLKKRT